MRRESSQLRRHAQSLATALRDVSASAGSKGTTTSTFIRASAGLAATLTVLAATVTVLEATANDLDEAGAALQRYATDLAEGHELGRRAERRVQGAGLALGGTRVTEPWGPASAQEAERRLAQVPDVQARVDLATAHVGRVRGRLQREMTRLTADFSAHSQQAQSTRFSPLPLRRP